MKLPRSSAGRPWLASPRLALALFALALFACTAAIEARPLPRDAFTAFRAASHDRSLRDEIVGLATRAVVQTVRGRNVTALAPPRHALLRRRIGIFVTLVEHHRVRGCMGDLDPVTSSAAGDIARAARLAASEDLRYPPLRPSELDEIRPVVSVIGPLRRVLSPAGLDPVVLGLFVQQGGRGAVLLPGEALSPARQIAVCKAKAGIAPAAYPAMYVFPTVVFEQRRSPR